MGVLPDAHEYRPQEIYHDNLGMIPDNYDARKAHPECPIIQEIRDQGYCGNCWAVAFSSVMSDRICLASNGTQTVRISENHLTSCCHICGFGMYFFCSNQTYKSFFKLYRLLRWIPFYGLVLFRTERNC
jgi:cathepsin B